MALYPRVAEDGRSMVEEIRREEEYERMAGGEEEETWLFRVELSVWIRRVEIGAEPDDSLFERGATAALFPLEGIAGPELTLRLLLRLPEETRESEAEGRSPETVRAFRRAELPDIREEGSAADVPWLLLKVEGRIWGFVVRGPEGTALCSPGLRSVGLTSGCLACIVRLPRRDASVRLRATLEMCRFWSWFLWTTVRAWDPPG